MSARAADGELDTRGGYHPKLVTMPRDIREPMIRLPTGEEVNRAGARCNQRRLLHTEYTTSGEMVYYPNKSVCEPKLGHPVSRKNRVGSL